MAQPNTGKRKVGMPAGYRKPKPVTLSITVTDRTAATIDNICGPGERGQVIDKLVGLVDLIARAAAHEFSLNLSDKSGTTVRSKKGPGSRRRIPAE